MPDINAGIAFIVIDSEEEESDRKRKKLKKKLKAQMEEYNDLKVAFNMMEKRMQDRINRLKNANDRLTFEKVTVDNELAIVVKQYRDLTRKLESSSIGNAKIYHLENLVRQKDQDLAICAGELRDCRKERQVLYDMASDAQNYGILVERLLKAAKLPHVVWPHRPFEVSLNGIKE